LCVSVDVGVEILVVLHRQRGPNKWKKGAVLHYHCVLYVGVYVLPIRVVEESDYFTGRIDRATLSGWILGPSFVLLCYFIVVVNYCSQSMRHVEHQTEFLTKFYFHRSLKLAADETFAKSKWAERVRGSEFYLLFPRCINKSDTHLLSAR